MNDRLEPSNHLWLVQILSDGVWKWVAICFTRHEARKAKAFEVKRNFTARIVKFVRAA